MAELTWTRRYSFQSVHSLNSGALKERLHGHHYHLEITFTGRDINEVDEWIENQLLAKVHGVELKELQPSTGENIVNWIHDELLKTFLAPRLKAVALQETRKNRFISTLSESRYV